ncbi:MAG: tripartite tricarboxylate transporter substrate binding protein [Chloroflexota bacterium]
MVRSHRPALMALSLLAVFLAAAACSSAAPPAATKAPEPTKAAAPAAQQQPAAPAQQAAAPTTAAAAQPATDWPKQPITLVVPWAAGGDTDVPMRVVAEFVGKELGQPVVVQNVTGASGVTGTRQAKGAKPDGYTLLSIHDHVHINHWTGMADYDWDAFDPIAFIVSSPEFQMTEASQPWNSMKELIEDAKKRPGQITAGVTFGSTAQMFVWMIMYHGGVQFKPVGYDGTAQRVTALLGKQIDIGASPLSSALEQYKAKRVKLLGYAYDERDPRAPDVPTFKEQGLNFNWGTNRGWVAPKGTPAPIIAKIEAALKKVTENPEFKKKIEDEMGSKVKFMPHDQYAQYLAKASAEMKKVIEETGMKPKAQ